MNDIDLLNTHKIIDRYTHLLGESVLSLNGPIPEWHRQRKYLEELSEMFFKMYQESKNS
jgi:hypothetical protein